MTLRCCTKARGREGSDEHISECTEISVVHSILEWLMLLHCTRDLITIASYLQIIAVVYHKYHTHGKTLCRIRQDR